MSFFFVFSVTLSPTHPPDAEKYTSHTNTCIPLAHPPRVLSLGRQLEEDPDDEKDCSLVARTVSYSFSHGTTRFECAYLEQDSGVFCFLQGDGLTRASAATKYHLIDGSSANKSTFMPKKPERKVSGRKMNVIQLSLHRLALSSRDKRVSLMATDLYSWRVMSVSTFSATLGMR